MSGLAGLPQFLARREAIGAPQWKLGKGDKKGRQSVAKMPAVARRGTLLVASCMFFAAIPHVVRAQDVVKWKTGAEFNKALRTSISRSATDIPLKECLATFSQHAAVAILLDRRVDPDRLVTISVENTPLLDELKDLAQKLDLGVANLGPVVYVGPKATTARLEALSELRKREAASSSRKGWLTSSSSSWEDLAEPRALAEEIVRRAAAKLANPEAIPHDVWAAWSGPALSNIDRLTLILAGFDLTCELRGDGAEAEIVPAPDELVFERTYETVGAAATVARDLKQKLPDLKQVQPQGANRLKVTTSAELHAKVADLLAGNKVTTKTVIKPGEKVYTFTATDLVGVMVNTLAKEAELEVKAEASLIDKLKERRTVEVEKVPLEAALHKVLDPVGIKFRITGKVLELSE
jgi:hypothetical protein